MRWIIKYPSKYRYRSRLATEWGMVFSSFHFCSEFRSRSRPRLRSKFWSKNELEILHVPLSTEPVLVVVFWVGILGKNRFPQPRPRTRWVNRVTSEGEVFKKRRFFDDEFRPRSRMLPKSFWKWNFFTVNMPPILFYLVRPGVYAPKMPWKD